MASGELPAAEAALRDVLDIAPDSTRALANLGALLQRTGHLLEAVGLYRRYLKLVPDDLEVRSNLANALMDAGCGEDALSECSRALNRDPGTSAVTGESGRGHGGARAVCARGRGAAISPGTQSG